MSNFLFDECYPSYQDEDEWGDWNDWFRNSNDVDFDEPSCGYLNRLISDAEEQEPSGEM